MTLAQELFQANPNLATDNDILAQGYELALQNQGAKSARYYFYYDEDFASDLVSEYMMLKQMETT